MRLSGKKQTQQSQNEVLALRPVRCLCEGWRGAERGCGGGDIGHLDPGPVSGGPKGQEPSGHQALWEGAAAAGKGNGRKGLRYKRNAWQTGWAAPFMKAGNCACPMSFSTRSTCRTVSTSFQLEAEPTQPLPPSSLCLADTYTFLGGLSLSHFLSLPRTCKAHMSNAPIATRSPSHAGHTSDSRGL